MADSEAALKMSPENQKEMTNLVAESGKLFGARHYRDYHFLLTLSDHVAHFGLEHHESNDSRLPERALLAPGARHGARRPAGARVRPLLERQIPPPRRSDHVPYYRSSRWKPICCGATRGLPIISAPCWRRAAACGPRSNITNTWPASPPSLGPGRPGRTWRPLLDTAVGEPGMGFGGEAGSTGGAAPTTTTKATCSGLKSPPSFIASRKGQKSIDDFCQAFHGGANNGPEVKTYTFDELVAALNAIAPFDWAAFFHARLDSTAPEAPVGGIENGGWKVVFSGEPSKLRDAAATRANLLDRPPAWRRRRVGDSIVGSPAFEAGISSGMKVIGVNGRVYTHDLLEDAIKAAKDSSQPITLLVVDDDYIAHAPSTTTAASRYPHLVREDKSRTILTI